VNHEKRKEKREKRRGINDEIRMTNNRKPLKRLRIKYIRIENPSLKRGANEKPPLNSRG
jgi:hypothetical protein